MSSHGSRPSFIVTFSEGSPSYAAKLLVSARIIAQSSGLALRNRIDIVIDSDSTLRCDPFFSIFGFCAFFFSVGSRKRIQKSNMQLRYLKTIAQPPGGVPDGKFQKVCFYVHFVRTCGRWDEIVRKCWSFAESLWRWPLVRVCRRWRLLPFLPTMSVWRWPRRTSMSCSTMGRLGSTRRSFLPNRLIRLFPFFFFLLSSLPRVCFPCLPSRFLQITHILSYPAGQGP